MSLNDNSNNLPCKMTSADDGDDNDDDDDVDGDRNAESVNTVEGSV